MNRRIFLVTALAGGAVAALPGLSRSTAQQATPEPDTGVLTIRWELQQIASGRRVLTPDDPTKYWFQLLRDGKVAIQADCNQAGGRYVLDGSSLTFSDLVSTNVACGPDSISDQFLKDLGYVVSLTRTRDASDRLVLQMMADGGTLNFQPALTGVIWEWVEFEGGDGTRVTATDPSRYTLEFLPDDTVQVRADCNRGKGSAKIEDSGIDLKIATTRKACPSGSQADDYLGYLDEAVSYVIRDGHFALALPADAGIARFRPTLPPSNPATPVSG